MNDLLGEHVDFFFSGFPAAVAQVKAGKTAAFVRAESAKYLQIIKQSGVKPE